MVKLKIMKLRLEKAVAARRFLGRYGNPFAAVGVDAQGRAAIEWGVFHPEPASGDSDDLLIREDNVFGTAAEDARRRDFTINGLFYDPTAAVIHDYVDGLSDLEAGLLRTIGDPRVRFAEGARRHVERDEREEEGEEVLWRQELLVNHQAADEDDPHNTDAVHHRDDALE